MIYIHFPFCKSFCTYCDFYSVRERENISKYTDALLREMDVREGFLLHAARDSVSTLYIGGGTPSLLPADTLSRILKRLHEKIGNIPFKEFTHEINPDDITLEYALKLKELGVNRASMGIQSFNDLHLHWMNRRHNAAEAVEAFEILRNAGFDNISIDLIFGYDPKSDGTRMSSDEYLMESWREDVEKAVSLTPEHISAYQMSIEKGSCLGKLAAAGKYREPEDEICARQYALLQNVLHSAGYVQYEISNFSKEGYRSIHNSAYWERLPYIGLGPAAHSFDGNVRSWNFPDIKNYISYYVDNGAICYDSEILGNREIREEKIMLGLRKVEGMSLKSVGSIDSNLIQQMERAGSLVVEEERIRIPADKLFISDSIIRSLF